MNATPRRPALRRPLPDHPFGMQRVVDDDDETSSTQQPVAQAETATDDAPADPARLKGGRKSYRGQATTVTFVSPEEYDRVKYAYAARGLREGYPSMNEWMCAAILAAVEDLESRYNEGRPFTAADAAIRRRR